MYTALGALRTHDAADGRELPDGPSGPASQVVVSPDGERLVTVYQEQDGSAVTVGRSAAGDVRWLRSDPHPHWLNLAGFAPDGLLFPPLIELLIAASIFYVAIENIVGGAAVSRRWWLAFAFGLIHGFGFAFALQETLQFAGAHLLTSLLAFNVGVEIGQVLVLLLLVPVLHLLFTRVVAERMGTIVLSAVVAHVGWHWMADRVDAVRPALDAVSILLLVRFSLVAVSVVAMLWVGYRFYEILVAQISAN